MSVDPVTTHGVVALLAQLGPDLLAGIAGVLPMDQAPVAPVPEDNEVKAGWTALLLWLGMALAVVVLALSFFKRLRRTRAHFDQQDPARRGAAGPDPDEEPQA